MKSYPHCQANGARRELLGGLPKDVLALASFGNWVLVLITSICGRSLIA